MPCPSTERHALLAAAQEGRSLLKLTKVDMHQSLAFIITFLAKWVRLTCLLLSSDRGWPGGHSAHRKGSWLCPSGMVEREGGEG